MRKNNTPKKPTKRTAEDLQASTGNLYITTDNSQADPFWPRLAQAIAVILNDGDNDATPTALREPVMDFLHSNSGGLWGELIVTAPIIQKILLEAACKEEEADNATN